MSRWSSPSFNFETHDGRILRVSLELFSTGSYEEPSLELDGEPLIEELFCDPETPDRIPVGSGLIGTCPNPDYVAREVSPDALSPDDRKRLDARIEAEIDSTLDANFDSISQDILECQADALYDAWRDREMEGD